MDTIQTIAVFGAGTMGSGIAHVFARSGFDVLLFDIEERLLDQSLVSIHTNLGREAVKGKLTQEEVEAAMARIRATTERGNLAAADLVVEAANERYEVKSELFRSLDKILPKEAILASNTSSISITKLAA